MPRHDHNHEHPPHTHTHSWTPEYDLDLMVQDMLSKVKVIIDRGDY